MDIQKCRYLLAIDEVKSFSKAAAALFVSQPYLSRMVGEMERELGVKIFERQSGKMTITPAGECLLGYARKIVALDTEAKSALSSYSEFKKGTIKIGVPPSRGSYILPPVIRDFTALYPGIKIHIEEADNRTLIEHTTSGILNFCFFSLPEYPPELEIQVLKVEDICLVLPPNHRLGIPAAKGNFRDAPLLTDDKFKQLDGEPFIILKQNRGMGMIACSIFDDYQMKPVLLHEITNIETAYRMAAYGLGAAFIPEHCALFSSFEDQPYYFRIGQPHYQWMHVVAYKKGYQLNTAEHAIIGLVKKYS